MPMVTLALPCGCKPVVHYLTRVPWEKLPKSERAKIIQEASADHVCKQGTKPLANPGGVPIKGNAP